MDIQQELPAFEPRPGRSSVLIEAAGIGLELDGRTILERVDLQIRAREIVTLIGPNGAGKTSLLEILLGLRESDFGGVRRAPGLRIAFTPQHFRPDPAMPLSVRRFLDLGAQGDDADFRRSLDEVGLAADLLGRQLAALSGGELHRAVLARALRRRADLLVLDEPMSGVDVAGQAELYAVIRRLRDERGFGMLLVSHDLHMVMGGTDRVVCLDRHIRCSGKAVEVANDPAFLSLFGPLAAQALALYHHSPAAHRLNA